MKYFQVRMGSWLINESARHGWGSSRLMFGRFDQFIELVPNLSFALASAVTHNED